MFTSVQPRQGVKLSSPAVVQTTDGLRAEKEELEKMINRLEGEVAATKTDLDQMTAQRDASVSEQDAIASRLDELMDTSAKEKALVEADRDDKDAQIESLEKELADVKETLEESNAQFIDSITTAVLVFGCQEFFGIISQLFSPVELCRKINSP